jgi:hypothetical protein
MGLFSFDADQAQRKVASYHIGLFNHYPQEDIMANSLMRLDPFRVTLPKKVGTGGKQLAIQ